MLKDPDTASDISSALLMRTGQSIMSGAFDDFAACFALPYRVETVESARILNTTDDLRATFEGVRAHLLQKGVTLMSRHSIAAEFRGTDQIAATHETRLMRDGDLVQEPYAAFSVLKRDADDLWHIYSTSYVITDSPGLNTALILS